VQPAVPGGVLPRLALVAAAALLLIGRATPAMEPARAASPSDPLGAGLEAVLASAPLRGARTAALVVRADDGAVLFAHDSDRPLVPASNLKLLTAFASLETWGPAHRFTTEVLADRAPDAEGAVGWLAVRGGGDPALTSEDLWRLAADLRLAGLRRVRGPIVLDDSYFDRERWNRTWGEISERAYHAPIGALSVNYGAFRIDVSPGPRAGTPVRVAVDPPVRYLEARVRAVTTPPGSRVALDVQRVADADGEPLLVSGSLPAGSEPMSLVRRVDDPARYAGAVLRLQLQAVGISVEGPTQYGVASEGVRLLGFEGRPLGEIVRLMLKFSSNPIAEALLKGMGAASSGPPGTWENGVGTLRARLAEAGLDATSLTLRDGSGLSPEDRVSPRFLVALLRAGLRSFALGPELVSALPIAGADGTLRHRELDDAGRVRAKSGLLARVVALSGFADGPDGERRIFSVLLNGYRCSDEEAMKAADAFAAAVADQAESNAAPAAGEAAAEGREAAAH
jgi:D-alanyl-D-alanine carboxypeptidase/D-alanyl-D-alanine-endopeptidase (penicillin-binding protein 4)